jgi:transposase-like protein
MEQLKVHLRKKAPNRFYSEAFKRKVVAEFEQGYYSKNQLQRKYGIGGKSRLLQWCRIYGKFAYDLSEQKGRPMKDPQKQRIKELEKKLKDAELKLLVYDKLIEVTNRELDQDVIKKIEAELSRSLQQHKNK